MKDVKQFGRGVFWTLFVGMALWIAFDISNKVISNGQGYTAAQRKAMADVVALSLEDLK